MVSPFSSLRSRILVLATGPLVALLFALLWLTHHATTRAIEDSVRRSLNDAASVLGEMVASRHDALLAEARVIASDPRFFATFSVPADERGAEFEPTLELLGRDFLAITNASFMEIYSASGDRLVRVVRDGQPASTWTDTGSGKTSVMTAVGGEPSSDALLVEAGAVLVADVPILLGYRQEGALRMGRWLDANFAREVSRLTSAQVALGRGDQVAVSTFLQPLADTLPLGRPDLAKGSGAVVPTMRVGDSEYLMADVVVGGATLDGGFTARLGRTTEIELAPLRRTERVMAALGLMALSLTVGGGLVIAFGVTRPLNELVRSARRLSDGDYDQPVPVHGHDEVAVLARNFEEARLALRDYLRHLQDVDKLKSDFLSLAGHELRTPLTIITSFNDIMHSGALGDLPGEVEETTSLIKERLTDLNELVADIIDLTALEQDPKSVLRFEPVELRGLLFEVEREHAPQRVDRVVSVDFDTKETEAWVLGDERLLRRAIRSLLDNAVRFTPDEGRVSLGLHRERGEAFLTVRDTGIGIRPEDMRFIFDKFYEGGTLEHHSSGHLEFQSRGLGMGLALARTIVATHGGRLDVDSQPGKGSCFSIIVPLCDRPPAEPQLQQAEAPTPEPEAQLL